MRISQHDCKISFQCINFKFPMSREYLLYAELSFSNCITWCKPRIHLSLGFQVDTRYNNHSIRNLRMESSF